MKKLFGLILGLVVSACMTVPTYAATRSDIADTIVTGGAEKIQFGSNLMVAGNATSLDSTTVKGLLFGFGNQIQLRETVRSDYAFIAGNIVDYAAQSDRDLFVAGATVSLRPEAQIGGDVYAAGNIVKVETNLDGSLSIAAAQADLHNIEITGDLNLAVGQLILEGDVTIGGRININDDAIIIGLENAKYSSVDTYENETYEPTAAEIWLSKVYSAVALFIVFAIILAFYSRLNHIVDDHLTVTNFGLDVITGCAFLAITPVVILFLFLTLIGATSALILLVLYILAIYLARGFAGLWFGKLIVEKLAKSQTNVFVEALLGIALLSCISLIPVVGWIVGLWSTALGCGLIVQAIKPCKTSSVDGAESATTQTSPTSTAPARKAITSKSSRAASSTSAKSSAAKSTKSTKPKSK